MFQDLYLGGCSLTKDQLKIGAGVRDYFPLLKDNVRVGHLLISSSFTPDVEEDYFDILVNTQKMDALNDDCLIETTTVDHHLEKLNNTKLQGNSASISVFADPLADWKESMT